MKIHKTANIHETAKIAEDVSVGANAVIGEGVVLEKGVTIGANAVVEFAHIGENTKVSPFASIGGEPQDLGYKGEKTGVIIGKNCWIREFATVNRGSGEGTNTIVGDNCLLMAYTHVAHNCVLGDNVIMANAATIGGHTHVGFGAWLGGMSLFHQNVRIGDMSIISGGSATRLDILPYSKYEGVPANLMGINAIGLRRKGVDKESIAAIHKAIRILKSPEYNTSQAIEKIKEEIQGNEYIDKMIEFLKTSKRGVGLKVDKSKIYQGFESEE